MNLPRIIVKSMSGQIVIIIVLRIKQYELVYRLGEVLLANNCKQCTNQTNYHYYKLVIIIIQQFTKD